MWLYCAVLYDAVLVVAIVLLEDYPLEKMLLVLLALNPIDAVRVALLLHSDASALMVLQVRYSASFLARSGVFSSLH